MATVNRFLQSPAEFYADLQDRADLAEAHRHKRFLAVLLLQRMARGYLIRKHVAWLSKNATTIQCAFRVHRARKAYRAALRRAVRNKHGRHYARAAVIIQALYRGHNSRKKNFCYRLYRNWLANVTEKGERRAAEAAAFGIRSRADDLNILEEEARQWLAFVVFKLHHLLRTYVCAGVYSEPATAELSDFEMLLKSIHYTEYMRRLKNKYDEFVRKHRPQFSNKRLFPIIGDGADYWYLSLAEMYELTETTQDMTNTRHQATHHGSIHKEPFLWKKFRPPKLERSAIDCAIKPPPTPPPTPTVSKKLMHKNPNHLSTSMNDNPALLDFGDFHRNVHQAKNQIHKEPSLWKNIRPLCPGRGPFTPPRSPKHKMAHSQAPTTTASGKVVHKDPRFHLYVKHYTPQPALFDYVDFHINVLLKRKYSIENLLDQ